MDNETSGSVFRRSDVESMTERPLTDKEWEDVKDTYEWRKGLPEILTQRGWEIIKEALRSAGIKRRKPR